MKILITGNCGYVGTALTEFLTTQKNLFDIKGIDAGFFSQFVTGNNKLIDSGVKIQVNKDIRDLKINDLIGIEAVVHLAGISNDPIGKEFADVTLEINRDSTINLAKLCIEAGVKKFIFASSCSIYGSQGTKPKKENDIKDPLTEYARSKIEAEEKLKNLHLQKMSIVCLRFATACGWSNRLRLDLVVNDFVSSAMISKEIKILSNGLPMRPLIDVEDMARAILWALMKEDEKFENFLSINIGSDNNNFQVKEIANLVANQINNSRIYINENAENDKRSYVIDFSLFKKLAPDYQPKITLEESINRMISGFSQLLKNKINFIKEDYIRLSVLKKYIGNQKINMNLRWKN